MYLANGGGAAINAFASGPLVRDTGRMMAKVDDSDTLPMLPEKVGLIAIDLDGTLLRDDGSVSEASVKAIRTASERGIKVVIATARSPRNARKISQQLLLETLQINHNGALIFDPDRNKVMYHKAIDHRLAREAIAMAREVDANITVAIERLDKGYMDRKPGVSLVKPGCPADAEGIARVDDHLNEPVTKVMIFGQPQPLFEIEAQFKARFADRIGFSFTDMHLLTMVHPKVDKGRALEAVAKHYGVAQANVMAIGDAPNDLGMLTWAGIKVGMGNSWPAVRKAVDLTVPSNNDDGVAYAIEHYAL